MTFKKGVARNLPFVLTDKTDFFSRLVGKTYSDVTVKFCKAGGSWTTKSLGSGDIIEKGTGIYEIVFTASELDTKGIFIYDAVTSDSLNYSGAIQLEDTDVNEIGAKTAVLPADPASQSAVISAMPAPAPTVGAIDTQLSGTHGAGLWGGASGSGGDICKVKVLDTLSNPIDGCTVWVTTDLAGTNVVASGVTTATGYMTFMLNNGITYYIWKRKSGFAFTNPTTKVWP
jgi:hypothetical protein